MVTPTSHPVLLLAQSFEPLERISWMRALVLYFSDKVEIVRSYDAEVHSAKMSMNVPAVVRLKHYVRIRRRSHVMFSRAAIYHRDHYQCQYCHKQFRSDDLTLDHVIPVSRGGPRTWENIVTACSKCNRKKNDRTPDEAGMRLKTTPKKPLDTPAQRINSAIRSVPHEWREFLFLDIDLNNLQFASQDEQYDY